MKRLALPAAVPSAEHGLLLRASLLDDEAGRRAYRLWLQDHDPQVLDEASYPFLPALFRNLERLGVQDQHTDRLRGIWRHSWYGNNKLFHAAATAIETLEVAGVRTMLLKGAALTMDGLAKDSGVRPMNDADILVPREVAPTAYRALVAAGWTWTGRSTFERTWQARQSCALVDAHGHQLDLHWEALFDPGPDDGLWARARPALINGRATLVPSPADQLVLTLLHGVGWFSTPLRWLSDGYLILERGGIDWPTVVSEAVARQAPHRVATQLELLHQVLDVELPSGIVEELRGQPLTVSERLLQRARDWDRWPITMYVCSWDHSRRRRRMPVPVREPAMTFVMSNSGFTTRAELLEDLAGKVGRNLRRRATRTPLSQ